MNIHRVRALVGDKKASLYAEIRRYDFRDRIAERRDYRHPLNATIRRKLYALAGQEAVRELNARD